MMPFPLHDTTMNLPTHPCMIFPVSNLIKYSLSDGKIILNALDNKQTKCSIEQRQHSIDETNIKL